MGRREVWRNEEVMERAEEGREGRMRDGESCWRAGRDCEGKVREERDMGKEIRRGTEINVEGKRVIL